jgi:hypothetical protein
VSSLYAGGVLVLGTCGINADLHRIHPSPTKLPVHVIWGNAAGMLRNGNVVLSACRHHQPVTLNQQALSIYGPSDGAIVVPWRSA